MRRYSAARKESVIEKMIPPHDVQIHRLAEECGGSGTRTSRLMAPGRSGGWMISRGVSSDMDNYQAWNGRGRTRNQLARTATPNSV